MNNILEHFKTKEILGKIFTTLSKYDNKFTLSINTEGAVTPPCVAGMFQMMMSKIKQIDAAQFLLSELVVALVDRVPVDDIDEILADLETRVTTRLDGYEKRKAADAGKAEAQSKIVLGTEADLRQLRSQ